MDARITWWYYLIPEDKFPQIKDKADKLDTLRDRELSEEEAKLKEKLIDEINSIASSISYKVVEYKDTDEKKDGTIIEELVYRMDEAHEVKIYSDGYYFKFMVYITPEGLQKEYSKIEKIFSIIADHHLLKEEFLGKRKYLQRATEIFNELRELYKEAYENKCGIIKTDKVEWVETKEDEELEETEEVNEEN